MASTATTFAALLKVRNTTERIENLTLADRPLLARLSKSTEWSGTTMEVPVIDGNPQGTAAQSLAIAQGAASNSTSKKFSITIGDYFGSVDIGGKVMMQSRNNLGAFLENKSVEIDGLYEQIANNLHTHLWGNGGGALGTRGSLSGNVVTLGTRETVANFEVGMTIAASANDGSDAAHALRGGTQPTVTAVDREAGTVTLSNAAAITAFADGDSLFRYGDFFGNTGAGIIKGVLAYITATSSPAALFGMTRTSDPTRLAGCRVPSSLTSGLGIEGRIKVLGSEMAGTYQAKVGEDGFLHPSDWQDLEMELQSRGYRSLEDDRTRFGFRVLECVVGGKVVKIYADQKCTKGVFHLLRMQNWKLWSMGELIHPVQADGLTILRKSTTNDFEHRLESFPQLACNAPLHNGRVSLT